MVQGEYSICYEKNLFICIFKVLGARESLPSAVGNAVSPWLAFLITAIFA